MKLNFCWYEKYINCEFTSIYSLRFISTSLNRRGTKIGALTCVMVWEMTHVMCLGMGCDTRHDTGDSMRHMSCHGL